MHRCMNFHQQSQKKSPDTNESCSIFYYISHWFFGFRFSNITNLNTSIVWPIILYSNFFRGFKYIVNIVNSEKKEIFNSFLCYVKTGWTENYAKLMGAFNQEINVFIAEHYPVSYTTILKKTIFYLSLRYSIILHFMH